MVSNHGKVAMKKILDFVFGGWKDAYRDVQESIDTLTGKTMKNTALILFLAALVVTWFIYVPIHELLHVAGCVGTGGVVDTLILGREYGADFLKNVFPFIEPQTSRYAGRLTGFEPSNDAGYFVTVLAPFLLTPIPGLMALRLFIRKKNTIYLAMGIIIGLAPFWNLTGDYFEMGTIVSTLAVNLVTAGNAAVSIPAFWELRSDDIFRLFGEIGSAPGDYGMGSMAAGFLTIAVILLGFILAVAFAGWTYRISAGIVDKLFFKDNGETTS